MPDSLAEIVLEEGLLSAEEIAKAADASDKNRVPLVVPMVRDNGLDEVSLVAALKKHLRISVLDPAKVDFDSDALREVSLEEARRLRVVPISIGIYGEQSRTLRVACADPTDTIGITELEHLTSCRVEPVVVTLSAVEEMIETAYRHFVTEVMKRSSVVKDRGRSREKVASTSPTTAPHHHIAAEASLALQLRALVTISVDKGLFTQSEYDEILSALVKAEDKGGVDNDRK